MNLGFQQDTFATDSLRHILALLTSLGSHSFSLLTSISLTNRSKVKDLWIFTGPVPECSPVETPAVPDMRRQGLSAEGNYPIDSQQQHKKFATEPTAHLPSSQHLRSTTDGPQRPQYPDPQLQQIHLLRKPAPRAQVPISVFHDPDILDEHHQLLRAHVPSTISTGVENMTGVGTVGLKQDVLSKFSSQSIPPLKVGGVVADGRCDSRLGYDRVATPPLLTFTSPNQTPQSNAKDEKPVPSTNDFSSQPLLGITAFRDSAFSSNTLTPITWTGSYKEDVKVGQKPKLNPNHSSNGRIFPGGWESTPVDGKLEEETEISTSMSGEKGTTSTLIQENDCRIEAPVMVTSDTSLRKSEAALVRIIASTSHVPSIPQRATKDSGGQGWVLVNVESSESTRPAFGSESAGPSDTVASRPNGSKRPNSPLHNSPSLSEQPSPAAKAIVIMDAMDSKRKKRSTMQLKGSDGEGNAGLRRFFSLHKKNLTSEFFL